MLHDPNLSDQLRHHADRLDARAEVLGDHTAREASQVMRLAAARLAQVERELAEWEEGGR
ncbi:MAG: hypothetical protein R3B09_32275 [Nannocystaceae bacterium]